MHFSPYSQHCYSLLLTPITLLLRKHSGILTILLFPSFMHLGFHLKTCMLFSLGEMLFEIT